MMKRYLPLPSDRDREEISNLAALMENNSITYDDLAKRFSELGEANITYALFDHRWLMNPTLREPAQHWLKAMEGARQDEFLKVARGTAYATWAAAFTALFAAIVALYAALFGQDNLAEKIISALDKVQ